MTVTSTRYEAVIGMEAHAELLTASKMFCGCSTEFGAPPNTQCCPVCLGLPGSLPMPNRKAVDHVLRTALALNCTINLHSIFHRKNYFYPDLPKAYQISQYDIPIGINGHIDILVNGETRRIRIRRVHLEEDTGKLAHVIPGTSDVDYNRSGVPLMEVVTEPDIHSADEAREYLIALRQVLVYIGACDGRMEQGSLRCEPNISVRPAGSDELGVKTELKNLNSFRVVHLGVQAEVARQIAALERGEPLVQETRRWDEARGVTASMRTKEYAHDYRYFPEPDLVPLAFDDAWIEAARASLPELPEARRRRFVEEYALPEYDAAVLTAERAMADYVDEAMRACPDKKAVSNWLMGDFLRLLKSEELPIEQVKMRPAQIGEMLRLIEKGVISGKIAKTVFEELFHTGKPPEQIVQEKGLTQISDESALATTIDQVMAEQAEVVAQIRAGKEASFKFLVGQVMRATKGRANPEAVNRLLREKIDAGASESQR
jgi:aspartyl-tRNA(Asn)/glutamyl-tRNA(Gln) amidotransferase subunit B